MVRTITISLVLLLNLTACGPLIGPMMNSSVKTNPNLNISQPLRVDQNKAARVRKVAVPYLAEPNDTVSKDDWRIYKNGLDALIDELKKNSNFEVVALSVPKQKEMGVFADVVGMSDEEEIHVHFRKIARAANCDAALFYSIDGKKVNQGAALATAMLIGTVDVPVTMSVDIIPADSAKSIYRQEQDATLTMNEFGFKNTPDKEFKELMRPAVKPLVLDLSGHFTGRK